MFLYDLHADLTSSVSITKMIKEKSNVDIKEQPKIKRDYLKRLWTATVKFTTEEEMKQAAENLKYFKLGE